MSDIETAALRFQAEMMANDWLCDSTVGHEVGTCLGCITVALVPAITAYNEAIGNESRGAETSQRAEQSKAELAALRAENERLFSEVTALMAEVQEWQTVGAENERLRDRIESLRDGLAEVAAGDPDVTPAGLPTALRSRAKATLDIDDEDEAALHPQEGTDE